MEKNTRCRVCCVCLILVAACIIAGVIAGWIFWVRAIGHDDLVYESHHPRPYLRDLYVPSLVNKTTTFNASVFVHLTFERDVAVANYSCGDFRVILSYGEHWTKSIPVGSCTVKGFSMGHKKTVDVKAVVEATEMPWEKAFRALSVDYVAMVVELMMSDALDELPSVASVKVDDSGHMVKRPILLEQWNPRWNV